MRIQQERSPILNDAIAALESELGPGLQGLMVERVVIGLFFSGVKLSNSACGICYTPVKEIPESLCCPSSAAAIPDSVRLAGLPITAYLEYLQEGRPLKKALAIAAINALSQTCWRMQKTRDYTITPTKDPLNGMSIPDDAFVVVVGALLPYLRMLKKRALPCGHRRAS